MQTCKCGACSTDGGTDYIRRGFKTEKAEDCFEDLSTYQDIESGQLLTAKEVDMAQVPSMPAEKEANTTDISEEPEVLVTEEKTDFEEFMDQIPTPVSTSEEPIKPIVESKPEKHKKNR